MATAGVRGWTDRVALEADLFPRDRKAFNWLQNGSYRDLEMELVIVANPN